MSMPASRSVSSISAAEIAGCWKATIPERSLSFVELNTAKPFLFNPSPKLDLLFDPQTSGGLLFGMPESAVANALAKLDHVAVIGEVTKRREDDALVEVQATAEA